MEQRVELKTRARELERNDQTEAALELYRRIVSDSPEGESGVLWARIGDLQERLGQGDSAADSYSRAVAAFAVAGQSHNAIALCRALLRVDPDSPGAQLRLGELSLAEGYREYARAGIGTFARQVAATGAAYDAVEPVAAFLKRFPDEDELWREWVEELLSLGKEDDAVAILGRLRDLVAEAGFSETEARLLEGIEKIRPSAAPPPSSHVVPSGSPSDDQGPVDLPLLGVDADSPETEADSVTLLEGLEPTDAGAEWEASVDAADVAEPLPRLEPTNASADRESSISGADLSEPLSLLDSSPPEVVDEDGAEPAIDEPLPLLGTEYPPLDDLEPTVAAGAELSPGAAPSLLTDLPGEFDEGAVVVPDDDATPSPTDAPRHLDLDQIFQELITLSEVEVESVDPASHYDLGLAFKEMGRVDEALANLAMAIRGGHDPAATLEVVGEMLVDRGRSDLVMRLLGAIPDAGERPAAELVGVHYWLARAAEESGMLDEARRAFSLVVAVDPDFRDASHRAGTLG